MDVKQVGNIADGSSWDNPQAGRIYDSEGISPTLNTCQGGQREPKIIVSMRGRNPDNPSDRTAGSPTEQRLEPNSQGICNTLTSVQKDNLVLENIVIGGEQKHQAIKKDGMCTTLLSSMGTGGGYVPMVPETVRIRQATKDGYIDCNIGGVADLSYPESNTRRGRVQENGEVCPTITAAETGVCRIESIYRIRKLTPLECWQLMGFSDEDFLSAKVGNREIAKQILETYPHLGKRAFTEVQRIERMSNTQLYKQAGNSIVKDVLVAIFGQMIQTNKVTRCNKQ